MGSVGTKTTKVEFPIRGVFTSKRGKQYNFWIYDHGRADLWQTKSVLAPGGNRLKDFYALPTKEFWDMAEKDYGVQRRRQ